LTAIYAETRRDELAPLGWSEEQFEAFCRMQFALQTQAYKCSFPTREIAWSKLKKNGRAVMVNRAETEIRLIDIAFCRNSRSRRGKDFIENLQREAETAASRWTSRFNDECVGYRLYERLGFVVTENNQTHLRCAGAALRKNSTESKRDNFKVNRTNKKQSK
jgi:hypothetical protein